MKLNRKGFMMAEVVVVSAVVLITLSTLYISYNKIYSLYRTRLNYNDVQTLYRLAYYRDVLINVNELSEETISKSNSSDENVDKNFLCSINKNKCREHILVVYNNGNIDWNAIQDVSQTYKEYINYLSDAVDFGDSEYIMLMEHCDKDNNNCKYAYLGLNKTI